MMTLNLFVGIIIGMGGISLSTSMGGIDEVLEAVPPILFTLSHLRQMAADVEGNLGITFVLHGEVGVGAPYEYGCCTQNDVELSIDGAMGLEGNCPNYDYNYCNPDFHQRGYRVGTAVTEEQVMEVCLVGLEGGLAFHNTAEHYAKRVSDGHCKDGKGEGDQT